MRAGLRCGVCYSPNWTGADGDEFGSAASGRTLEELAGMGIRGVSFILTAWMDDLTSVRVDDSPYHPRRRTFDGIRVDAARARRLGMQVVLKPQLWIRTGEWGGVLRPDEAKGGWGAWFASYQGYVLEVARAAEELGADALCAGTELGTSTRQEARWRALLGEVRRVYRGRLYYCGASDDVEGVAFWDAVDALSLSHYLPLSDGRHPSDDELFERASDATAKLVAQAERLGRPLVLSEVGFPSHLDATRRPWHWPPEGEDRYPSAEGYALQARAYQAILGTFGQAERVEAVYFWRWYTDPPRSGEGPTAYTPWGKPAAEVLRRACQPTAL